jgi:hypothetical protein
MYGEYNVKFPTSLLSFHNAWWKWRGVYLMTSKWFKNKCKMHICSTHKTHVRTSCNGTITGLPALSYMGTTLKGIAWIDSKCTYNRGKIAIQKLRIPPNHVLPSDIDIHLHCLWKGLFSHKFLCIVPICPHRAQLPVVLNDRNPCQPAI